MSPPEMILALLAAAGWATVFWNGHCDNHERNRLCDANLRLDEKVQALRRRHSRKPEVLAGAAHLQGCVVEALQTRKSVSEVVREKAA